MPLALGRFRLHEVRDATISLDGGAMFGIVPKPLWEKRIPADAQNRIPLALRCLLIEDGDRRILVDCGMGDLWDEKERGIYGLDRSVHSLDRGLAAAGTSREAITDVILTHLHFDHAGGVTRRGAGGVPELAFPNATHHLQRRNWKWAHAPTEKDRGSYRRETFAALEASGRLHLVEGPTELFEGVHLVVSEGHTVGLQLVQVEDAGQSVLFGSDVIPTSAHLRPAWVAAYDLYPLTAIEEKKQLLAQALEEDWIVFFEHDPDVAACRVIEKDGEVVMGEAVAF